MKLIANVAGRFKIEAVTLAPNGRELSRRVCADWFNNLITDQGLDYLGFGEDGANYQHLKYCHVGTSSQAPQNSDTALFGFVAATETEQAVAIGGTTIPYYRYARKTFRFTTGAAAGNLSEVGVGWGAAGSTLFSRALILDGVGNPTTITVLVDEVLDVTYEYGIYPPTADVNGVVVLDGINYDYIVRAAEADKHYAPSAGAGDIFEGRIGWGEPINFIGQIDGSGTNLMAARVYNGDIGLITGLPAGSKADISVGNIAYVATSLQRESVVSATLGQGNLAGGIRSLALQYQLRGYQVQFDPPIPKNATNNLSIRVRHSWGRYVAP